MDRMSLKKQVDIDYLLVIIITVIFILIIILVHIIILVIIIRLTIRRLGLTEDYCQILASPPRPFVNVTPPLLAGQQCYTTSNSSSLSPIVS